MSPFSSPSSSPPPSPSRRRLKTCARRCERACCALATYFPLAFVYSLTTWAAWVEASIGLGRTNANHLTPSVKASSLFGVCLYLLLNTCYTTAVFTDPGSPLDPTSSSKSSSQRNGNYSVLPTSEPDLEPNGSATTPHSIQNITVSSRGGARFCKKCQTSKPDRAHHCSSCRRCVLKMDHHCPWLATCLGIRNYKPFVLFLVYTSIFCWVCFLSSGFWMWDNLFSSNQYLEEYAPINIIMLCVISGIIGLVLTGFTGWHLYLCVRGQTTIECLEKTRYLSGVRSRVERNRLENMHSARAPPDSQDFAHRVRRAGDQILEFHANAVPGASRYEEGEEHSSPAPSLHVTRPSDNDAAERQYHDHPQAYSSNQTETPAVRALRRSYHQQSQSSYEHDREADRYNEYLDDREGEKLPNAFDLGWRRNLAHVFGPNPWLRWLPVCNTTGDGWRWEVSEKWVRAREGVDRRRAERQRHDGQWYDDNSANAQDAQFGRLRGGGDATGLGSAPMGYDGTYDNGYENTDFTLGRPHHSHSDTDDNHSRSVVSMQTLDSMGAARRGRERVWGGRYRRDVDRSGEDGEEGSFEVSDDEVGG